MSGLPASSIPAQTTNGTLIWDFPALAPNELWEGVLFFGATYLPSIVSIPFSVIGDSSMVVAPNAGIAPSGNHLQLSWNSVPNATSYNIYGDNTQPYFAPVTPIAGTPTTSWQDTNGIADSDNHYYLVQSVGSCNESGNLNRIGAFKFPIHPGN